MRRLRGGLGVVSTRSDVLLWPHGHASVSSGFASRKSATVEFYESLGFVRFFELPTETGEPGYVGLRRDASELAVVDAAWPSQRYERPTGVDVRFEMFVYVDDVDAQVAHARTTAATVLRELEGMPWGERVAYVEDPDGNSVALAASPPS